MDEEFVETFLRHLKLLILSVELQEKRLGEGRVFSPLFSAKRSFSLMNISVEENFTYLRSQNIPT